MQKTLNGRNPSMAASRMSCRRVTGVVLSVGLAVLLAACASGENDRGGTGKDDVASLASDGPKASDKPVAQERPLIRTDTSKEEEQRLYDEYERCLKEHGDPRLRDRKAPGGTAAPRPAVPAQGGDEPPEAVAAAKACENKEPETVWERAKRTDPNYADKLRDWVTCIRASGIDAWEQDGFLSFNSLPSDDQMKQVDKCQDKAFGTG